MKHQVITAASELSPSWAIRWQEAKGTWSEKEVLMSIAAQAEKRDRDVFAAAYDAATATDPDERAEHIADLEQLFADADEWERDNTGRDDCAGWRGSSYASMRGMGGHDV